MNSNAMFNISYGLYVLTANEDGKDNGCIVNTLSQVTSTVTYNYITETTDPNIYPTEEDTTPYEEPTYQEPTDEVP